LFRERLGPGPLSQVKDELMQCHFRAVWLAVYLRYHSKLCLGQLKSTPVEFIESMRNLIHLYETYDNREMNERTQLAYILQALQRANSPIYAEDLKHSERDQHDLHWCWELV
jgi:hypothetical protein